MISVVSRKLLDWYFYHTATSIWSWEPSHYTHVHRFYAYCIQYLMLYRLEQQETEEEEDNILFGNSHIDVDIQELDSKAIEVEENITKRPLSQTFGCTGPHLYDSSSDKEYHVSHALVDSGDVSKQEGYAVDYVERMRCRLRIIITLAAACILEAILAKDIFDQTNADFPAEKDVKKFMARVKFAPASFAYALSDI
ncbi:hypothetical protein H2198_001266 [Neophaeococcomyces mojaviensis]|uniref:Uncharacterized protein n=1 Tax=Neophaeococcomyces mojaviensis TaxID=3383035 RepID=A0ACC3AHA9_9EURO|nr:hypothetical protein H2198_001266 [Knufia sp. JES_112]